MLEEYKDRIDGAKNKFSLALERYHIGDTVYPFFAKNLVNWGTVVDIDVKARKIIVNFNGVERQFDPEWLIHTNPDLNVSSNDKETKIAKKVFNATMKVVRIGANLTVPQQHQKKIAIDTLKMPDAMVGVMGGMDKEAARKFLKSIGYSDAQIKKLEE